MIKRLFALLLSLTMVASMFSVGSLTAFAAETDGVSTESTTVSEGKEWYDENATTLNIENKEELLAFASAANAGNTFSGKTIKLTADIDLGGMTWTPIKNFLGTFDGGNHTISNFYLDATKDHAGFFYKINYGNGTAIKNLTLSDITATVGNYYVGALAYFSFAVQDYITIRNFTVTTTASEANVGGYAGWVEWGHIRNCTIENMVVNAENGAGLVGGLAAVLKADNWLQYNNIDVNGFKVTINDTDGKYAEVGGLVGQTQTGHDAPVFTNCDIKGIDVTASGLVTVGGFVARPGAHTTAKNCTTEGKIDVTGVTSADEAAGGFFGNLGWNNNESSRGGHKLTDCTADVDIATKIAPAGGFVGSATNEQNRNMAATFTKCTAQGEITVAENGTATIGGFAGKADRGTYNNCTAVQEPLIGEKLNDSIVIKNFVAQIGEQGYESLQDAIDAATAGDTITFLDDITENVTINNNLTIDGADNTYTGTMTITGNFDVTVQNVNCVKGYIVQNGANTIATLIVKECSFANGGYAITTERIENLIIEDCTVTGQSLLYAKLTTTHVVVKNVTLDNGNYLAHLVYGTDAYFENVKVTNGPYYGICTQNYGAKAITLKDCSFDAQYPLAVRNDRTSASDTFIFEGVNTMSALENADNMILKLAAGATLTAPEGLTIITDVADHEIVYDNGVYSVAEEKNYVAQIGEQKFESLQDAINACKNGETIKILTDITYTEDDVVYAHGGATGFGKYDQYNPSIIYVGGTKGATDAENQPSDVNAVIDLNGHTIKNTANAYFFLIMDNAKVTFKDSFGGGAVINESASYPVIWAVGTDTLVTVEGGLYQTNSPYGVVHVTHSGDLVLSGGEFKTMTTDELGGKLLVMLNSQPFNNPNYFLKGVATVTINGGTFHGFNPAEVGDDYGAKTIEDIKFVDGCAEGFVPEENSDGTYGVKKWYDEAATTLYINDIYDLLAFAAEANSGNNFSGKSVELTADIDLDGMTWTPIASFAGNFVGNNKTIKNFRIEAIDARGGFFNVIAASNGLEDVKVKDLVLSDVTATVGNNRFGTLANSIQGVVHNVTVKNVTVTTTHTGAWVGGMAAFMSWPWMTNCTVENLIVNAQAGADLIGGFACILQKNSNHVFDNLDVTGFKVIVDDTDSSGCGVGGFVAQTQRGWENPKVINCDITGIDVTASGLVDVGGFIAWPGAHTIAENCTTEGKIDVTGVTSEDCFAGGFFGNLGWNPDLGQKGHLLTNCSADVDIITKSVRAGGFIGSATVQGNGSKYLECIDCSVSGDVTVVEGGTANIGGFAGDADRGVYENCSASGTVTNNGTGTAGQFIGVFKDVTPKYDHRYPAGTRDYLVDVSTLKNCTYTGASTELSFIGSTAEGADVTISTVVAQIGDTYYETFEEAVKAVQNGQTIVLLSDVTLTPVTFGHTTAVKATVDLAGFTITSSDVAITAFRAGTEITLTNGTISGNSSNGTLRATYGGTLVLGDNLVVKSGGHADAIVVDTGELKVTEGAVVEVIGGINCMETADDTTNHITITGGTFTGKIIINENSTCVITGGTFTQDIAAYCADGYASLNNGDGTWTVIDAVAKVGDKYYATFADAIKAATAGQTITFLDDINESVTINKNLTIDGANFKYTGKMNANAGLTVTVQNVNFVNGGFDKDTKSTSGNYTIKNCTFDGEGSYAYSLCFKGANKITIEDCTVKNYMYSFLYVTSGTNTVSVKNVTVEDCPSYAVYFASGVNTATFENLTVKNSNNGFVINNTANRTFTIKNCNMENVVTAINHANGTKTITCNVLGANDFGDAAISQYAKFVLAAADATLEAPAGLDVTTSVAGYLVEYKDGVYKALPEVAKVGDKTFASLQAAIDAAENGDTVVLLKEITLTDADMVKTEDDKNVMLNVTGKSITLNLNGKTINVDYKGGQYLFAVVYVADGAELTVTGNGTIDISDNGINVAYMFWKRGTTGSLTIENGTYHMDNSADSMVYTNGDRIVTVNGGTWTLDAVGTRENGFPCIFNTNGKNVRKIVVNGGTYNYDINHQYWCFEVDVPKEKALQKNENETWTVVAAVAYVGEKEDSYTHNVGYATLAEAFAAADTQETVTLLAESEANVEVKKNITFDLYGFEFTGTIAIADLTATLTAPEGLTVTIDTDLENYKDYKVVYEEGSYKLQEMKIVAKSATLSYDDIIRIRYKYKVTADVEEYGLLVFATAEDAATLDASKAIQTIELVKNDDGFYYGYSDGIPAKEMGDSQFVVGYAKLANDKYEYADVIEYSPKIYAKRMVEKEGSKPETKKLCNALMAYGAAAQKFMGYKTEDLMNVGFETVDYDESVLGESVFLVDKTLTNGFTTKSANLVFEGAITYRVKYAVTEDISSKTLYAEYTVGNKTGTVELDKSHYAYISGIAAKDMDEKLVVKPFYLTDSGEKVYGAELVYSGYEYCRRTIENSTDPDSIALAKAFAMYIDAADEAISK